jgi:Uma2 family endonuclease
MTAVLPSQPASPRAPTPPPLKASQHFFLRNVSWETYEALLADQAEEHVFLTYDNGNLELMSPLPKHDRAGALLARLIHAYTEVRGIPIATFGRTTWRKKSIAKGLEADECFYIRSEAAVRGREDIDLSTDPPPDLAIEIDMTRYDLKKQEIYAALSVGELWRFEEDKLSVRKLDADGKYILVTTSPNLPDLPLAEIQRFMDLRHGMGETQWVLAFRQWVQDQQRT